MGEKSKIKRAVVLLNLGGPTSMNEVKPFLFSLFYDPAIISLPNPFRYLLAKLISSTRYREASHIYASLGGKSPLLEETQKQAESLSEYFDDNTAIFIAMRHATPRTEQTFQEVKDWNPDEVILLPLYPQFSITTTGSAVAAWKKLEDQHNWHPKTQAICCYPTLDGFIDPTVAEIEKAYSEAKAYGSPKLILSAHGLPEKTVASGDPYQVQVEATGHAILQKLDISDLDATISYQSRVGPLEWIKPYTEVVLTEAAEAGRPIIMVPIAFVSEHSETLYELDQMYGDLASEKGSPFYFRVSTVSTNTQFIQSLFGLVDGLDRGFTCPKTHKKCAQLGAHCYPSPMCSKDLLKKAS